MTPEVFQLRWVPLREAVRCALSSMTPGTFVNDFQRDEFARYNRRRRDPMFITAAMLVELEGFPDAESLVDPSDHNGRTLTLSQKSQKSGGIATREENKGGS